MNRPLWSRLLVPLALVAAMAAPALPVRARGARAQEGDACAALVDAALSAVRGQCASVRRDQACLASAAAQAESQLAGVELAFAEAGDTVNVAEIETVRLGEADLQAGTWGVALMRIGADLPESAEEHITLLAFGDVEITNAVAYATVPPALVEVFAKQGSRVRGGPSVNTEVVGGLAANQAATADGRLPDGSWIRIRLPGADGARGWVAATLVTSAVNLNRLKIVDPNQPPEPIDAQHLGRPMQTFYFRAGQGSPSCPEAASGILIQTPAGVADVTLIVNGAAVQLASTAYLETPSRDEMILNVIEGGAQVVTHGVTKIVPAGARVRIPLNSDLSASGPPAPPEPYDARALESLPLSGLPREVAVAPALTQAVIDAYNVVPKTGQWQVTLGSETLACDGDRERFPALPEEPYQVAVRLEGGGARIVWGQTVYTRVEPGVYEALGEFGFRGGNLAYTNTLRVVDEARLQAESILAAGDECTLSSTAEAVYAGGS